MNAHPTSHPTDRTLQAYGLGQLDAASAESVDRHLEVCADCRQRVTVLSSSDGSAGRLREAQARPATYLDSVPSTEGLSLVGDAPAAASPPPASTLPPGLADHPDYEVLRELGQGGMGVVYLAQNTLMGRLEVLKVVSGHLVKRRGILERFLGEIRNAAKLHHPNIVAAYSAQRLGESFVLSMEYVEGFDLARLVKARGPLRVANACNYIHQAAVGLQHAHEHGMVHRDIKPGNLMLTRQGNRAVVKLLDFGLAKVQSEGAVDGGLTHEGQMLGTPDYIAPEQISNARCADIRADIYSLGCTLYYLLTGKPPFQGNSLYDILQAHHSMDATPLNQVRPDVPVQVAAIVAKMMAKEPERRFQEPREVALALKPFFMPGEAASPGAKPTERIPPAIVPPTIPATEYPLAAQPPRAAATLIESPQEMRQGRDRASAPAATLIETPDDIRRGQKRLSSPTLALVAGALLLLATLASVALTLAVRGRDQAGADRVAGATAAGSIPSPSVPPQPKAARPAQPPAADDPELLVTDARAAVRAGNLPRASLLLNRYLSGSQPRRQVDEARMLQQEIELATSAVDAEAQAKRLSDQQIDDYLASGGQPLVDDSVQTQELRPVYARTLLQAFRQESSRRRSALNQGVALARGPQSGPHRSLGTGSDTSSNPGPDADRLPANLVGSDDEVAPTPTKAADPNAATTIETVLDASNAFIGKSVTLDRLYKVGTFVTRAMGPDGHAIGWSVPIGGDDDRLISKGDGRVVGRDRYLVLDDRLGPVLKNAFDHYHFHAAARPAYKCTLTVTVRPMAVEGTRTPIVVVVGLEILGVCNFLQVAQHQYDKAFVTLHVTPDRAWHAVGDGPAWVERLGGQEKFVAPLRRKLRDLQRKAVADRNFAVVGNALQNALARSVNMAIANAAQQQRFTSAFFGR